MPSRREIELLLLLRENPWTAGILLDELYLAQMRATIRRYLDRRGASIPLLARELAIPPRRLRVFLHGAAPADEEWEAVYGWCAGRETPRVTPDIVAVGVLARWAPRHLIRQVRINLVRAIPLSYSDAGARFPRDAFDER